MPDYNITDKNNGKRADFSLLKVYKNEKDGTNNNGTGNNRKRDCQKRNNKTGYPRGY
jgi:hypothetical protein